MTDAERDEIASRVAAEETLRARIARELAPPRPADRSWLSDNVKWVAVTILIPLTSFIIGYWQEKSAQVRARADREIADARQAQEAVFADARNDVGALTALLPALTDPDPAKAQMATNILARLEQAQRGQSRFREVVAAIKAQIAAGRNSSSEAERERAARQQEGISQASGETAVLDPGLARTVLTAGQVNGAPAEKPKLIFIQIYAASQRPAADEVQRQLRSDGVAVPSIENVSRLLRGRQLRQPAQIRYFNESDLGEARWTAARLAGVGGVEWTVAKTRTNAAVPAGQLELWWPTPG